MKDDNFTEKTGSPSTSGIKGFALRIALSYAAVGSIWVLVFDILLPLFYNDSTIVAFSGIAEGWIYVTTTSWLLYNLIKNHLASLKSFTELVQSKEHYLAKVLETLPVGIWLIDSAGEIAHTNPAARKIRMSTENSIGSDILSHNYPAAEGKPTTAHPEPFSVLQSVEPVLNEVIDIMRDDGNQMVILHSAVPLRDEAGGSIGIVVVNQDITEVKRIERELLENQRQLTSLAAELSMAEERERRRIATELHDEIGQTLALCKIRLDQIDMTESLPLAKVRDLLNTAIHRVRTLTFEVSPPLLYQVGLEPAIEWLGERFHEEHGLFFRFHLPHKLSPLSEELRVTLFQIVRELLMNVAKHAQATSVVISLDEDTEGLHVKVTDDGVGFEAAEGHKTNFGADGFGIFNARRRIEHLGGSMTVNSRPGNGTTVSINLPLPEKGEI